MPIDTHLEWSEIRDFTPGLWDIGGPNMPQNAAQVMTDCQALPSGGLRAFQKRTSFTTTGVVNTTNEKVRGLWVNELLANRAGGGNSNDYWMLTYDTASTVCRLYRMDQTAAGPPVTWSVIKTFAAGLDPGNVRFTNYYDSTGAQYVVFSLGFGGGADAGVWYYDYQTATGIKLTGTPGQVFNYQSRLVVLNGSKLIFTDPALFTNIATNTAPVDPNEGHATGIVSIAPFSPGDLLVFKAAGPIYLVQGDLNNYTVRQMNASKFIAQGGVGAVTKGVDGVIFRALNDGIYVTPDGSQLFPVSKSLLGTHWGSGSGNFLLWCNHYLLDMGTGLVMDNDSKTWFTTTMQGGGTGAVMARTTRLMLGDNSAAQMTLWTLQLTDDNTGRAESYTWKSSLIRHETGRQIEIRAVEVYAKSYNGATSTVAVTINGVTRTFACDSGGQGALTFYFLARKEELDVQVVAASNAAGVEAPTIEVIRIGAQGGHYLRSVADAG